MTNWKNIHSEFTEELQIRWENYGFTYEETKKWIDLGLKPSESELADFIKNRLSYGPENIPHQGNIETFRQIYEKNLEQNEQMQFDDLQFQEAIKQSLLNLNLSKQIDQGWLTDDNIEYILKNDETIRQAKNIQIKTDIANIYLQMDKTKRGETIDADFWNSLDTKKKYVILPLRVSGNHWSLLLLVNSESTGKVNWVYYVSSLGKQAVEEEITEISSFLKQISKKFGSANNSIINENNLSEMVFQENPRQPNTWDCGVYLCKFIQFLCIDEYYNLNETNYRITEQEVKEFRDKWKSEIGEEKWCKWDTNIVNMSTNDEEQELQEAISRSLREKKQSNLSVKEEEEKLLQEALKKSLLVSEEESQVQEVLLSSHQDSSQTKEGEKIIEDLIKENNSLKTKINTLEEKIKSLDSQIFLQQIEIDNLKHQEIRPKEEEVSTEKLAQVQQELEQEKTKNQELARQLEEFKKIKNQNELQTKREKLKELVKELGTRIGEADDLDELLESQEEIIRNNDNSYAQKQLKKYKAKLLKKLTEEEVEEVCQLKAEVIESEIQLENLTEQSEAKILVPENRNW